MNIESHNVILGIPFIYRQTAVIGFNPTKFAYGCKTEGDETSKIPFIATQTLETGLKCAINML